MNTGELREEALESAPPGGKLFRVIYEDDGLLVINKPAGLVCHPTKNDERSSLIGRVRLHLGSRTRPHLVNRLDRETSGVIVVAKQADTAGQLGKIWKTRAVEKKYLAIAHGQVPNAHGVIDAPLGKDERSRVAIKDCVRADGLASRTEFWLERCFTRAEGDFSLMKIVPHTGRKHQIRIHLAHIGHPIVGDKLYSGDEGLYLAFVQGLLTPEQRHRLILLNHALHASEARFAWRGEVVGFRAEPENGFADFLACGG